MQCYVRKVWWLLNIYLANQKIGSFVKKTNFEQKEVAGYKLYETMHIKFENLQNRTCM